MGSQVAVDIVQLLLIFNIYMDSRAGIVAFAAWARSDVVRLGIGSMFAHGFQDGGFKFRMNRAHDFYRKGAREFN